MSMNVATACRDRRQLTPLAQVACNLFLSECKNNGIDLFVTETYRSQDRQDYLYAQGRTEPGNIVTWTKSSRHTSRLAWDVACNGAYLYDKSLLRKAGQIGAKLGIVWGGNWSTPDMPHFEISTSWNSPIKEKVVNTEKREENDMIKYNTINEIPEFARSTINKLIKLGAFADKNKLDVTYDMVRMFVINDRLGLYK